MYQVIVIGGGPAGVTAALRARELGASVVLVERGHMGGTCTNDGCVPTRVLAKAARLMRDAEQFPEYGLVAQPPALDFPRLLSRTQSVVYTMHEKKQLLNHLSMAGVEVFAETGNARFHDPHTLVLADGTRLEAEKFILCAGGRARRLDFPGEELALTHSEVWTLRKLPASVIIVGGAATGCQLASIFSAFGAQVTILEIAERILRVEDPAISRLIQAAFKERQIKIITNIGGIARIEPHEGQHRLVYTQAGETHELEAEAVVLSTGWLGNLDALNLAAAGVETQRGYVIVDDFLRTSSAHIFAAGDITGRMMLVQSASTEAQVAAENAILGASQRQLHTIVPHGGFTDPEYGSVGLTEEQARASQEVVTVTVDYNNIDRAVIDGHPVGLCKLIVDQEDHRILGAHVAGEQALEIVHIAAAGMAADMRVEQLAELQIAYPTFTAILGLAARHIVRELGAVAISPEWRTLEPPFMAEWEHRDAG